MKNIAKNIGLTICLATLAGGAFAQGESANSENARIVGGVTMDIGSAPATIALINNNTLSQTGSYFQSQFCGGTVIAARWVITAAHCLIQPNGVTPASDISILMGSTDLNEPVNQPIGVTRVVLHQQYDARSQANDIALLELQYDSLVNPASLDTQNITLNDEALIAGWGALNMGSNTEQQLFPTKLQGALVKMIPGDECGTLFPRYFQQVDSRNLCAGRPAGGVDSCQGDSGGPLYRYDRNNPGATLITGITSWGHGCAEADAPGVYVRVAAYTDWIYQNTGITSTGQPQPQPQPQPQQDDPQPGLSPLAIPASQPNSSNGLVANPLVRSSGGGASGYWILIVLVFFTALRLSRARNQN